MYEIFNMGCVLGAQTYIADESVDLIITDPPFGIDGDKTSRIYNRKSEFVLPGYQEVDKIDYGFFTKDWTEQVARILRPGGQIYVVSGYTNLAEIILSLRFAGLKEVNHIIWKFSFAPYTKNKFVSSHYHILLYEKFSRKHPRVFNRECRFKENEIDCIGGKLNYQDREDVWEIPKEYHPGKVKNVNKLPEALIEKMLQYSSRPTDTVCDFFLGNFTTASVCREMGIKNFIGFEISKEIYDSRIMSF